MANPENPLDAIERRLFDAGEILGGLAMAVRQVHEALDELRALAPKIESIAPMLGAEGGLYEIVELRIGDHFLRLVALDPSHVTDGNNVSPAP